jgi:hypothetical protein
VRKNGRPTAVGKVGGPHSSMNFLNSGFPAVAP